MTCHMEIAPPPYLPEVTPAQYPEGHRMFWHAEEGRPILTVQTSIDTYSPESAFMAYLNIRRWRVVSVGVKGSLQERLADQREIGRQRRGGERSPAPLPDWYDLSHIAYEHGALLGLDPTQPVWQFMPPPGWAYLNIAEALHLRQPA